MDNTLDELEGMINSDMFFRANRQFIISRKAIKDIDLWFNRRLSVNLKGFSTGKNTYKQSQGSGIQELVCGGIIPIASFQMKQNDSPCLFSHLTDYFFSLTSYFECSFFQPVDLFRTYK